jgi:hypothetical protein
LETIKQINQKHAELGQDGQPVNAKQVYAECGIRTLSDSPREKPSKLMRRLFPDLCEGITEENTHEPAWDFESAVRQTIKEKYGDDVKVASIK